MLTLSSMRAGTLFFFLTVSFPVTPGGPGVGWGGEGKWEETTGVFLDG